MAGAPSTTLGGLCRRVVQRVIRESRMRKERRSKLHTVDGSLEFVVVVTYGRTGSTVLQAALNTDPHTLVRGENHNVSLGLFRSWRSATRTYVEHGDASATDSSTAWFGAHLIDPERFLAEVRSTFVSSVLAAPQGIKLVGFKEIRNTPEYFVDLDELVEYVVFLDQLLPGVRFIVNSRDVAPTLQSGWWAGTENAEAKLQTSMEWMEQLPVRIEERLGPQRVHAMRYEHWSQNPEALAGMLMFLGLEADLEALERVSSTPLQHMSSK